MKKILVINGPNLNMLGKREPGIYGNLTLAEIEKMIAARAEGFAGLEFFQSNHEGAIIDKIQAFGGDAVIINAGAYTHYSYAIADALKILTCIKIEVHISNIYAREDFRRNSVLSPVCDACIAGMGADGYILALDAVINNR